MYYIGQCNRKFGFSGMGPLGASEQVQNAKAANDQAGRQICIGEKQVRDMV